MTLHAYIKVVAAAFAAAALAVPVAQAGGGNDTERLKEGFPLGVPLEYLAENTPAQNRLREGFPLGVPPEYLAPTTEAVASDGFDWGDAGIGAAMVAGVFLVVGGLGAVAIRARANGRRLGHT